jgi:hypothetical protein
MLATLRDVSNGQYLDYQYSSFPVSSKKICPRMFLENLTGIQILNKFLAVFMK